MKSIIRLAVIASLLCVPVAEARTPLTINGADSAARQAVDANYLQPVNPSCDPATEDCSTVTGYTLYSCDRESTYRVLCDLTTAWSDGASCNDTLEILQATYQTLVRSWVDWAPPEAYCYRSASAARTALMRPTRRRMQYRVVCGRRHCYSIRTTHKAKRLHPKR